MTIDSPHESFLHQHAAVNVVSGECLKEHYRGMQKEEVMKLLQETAEGLVIITSGAGEMLYGRKGENIRRMKPFSLEVRSTLGAGDTYKAGCIYALLHGMKDDELVRFASACSGIAVSRFPLPLFPPRTGGSQRFDRKAQLNIGFAWKSPGIAFAAVMPGDFAEYRGNTKRGICAEC